MEGWRIIHDHFMSAMLQQVSGGKRRYTTDNVGSGTSLLRKRRIVEGYGECWEKISTHERCAKIIAAKDQE